MAQILQERKMLEEGKKSLSSSGLEDFTDSMALACQELTISEIALLEKEFLKHGYTSKQLKETSKRHGVSTEQLVRVIMEM